jgi:hypothetical protein
LVDQFYRIKIMTAAKAKSNSQVTTLDSDAEEIEGEIPQKAEAVVAENHDSNLAGDMEIVTIHSSGDEAGGEAVLVIHNGYARQIPRDKPVELPFEVVQGLRDCVVTSYVAGPGGTYTERHTPRYAMSTRSVRK